MASEQAEATTTSATEESPSARMEKRVVRKIRAVLEGHRRAKDTFVVLRRADVDSKMKVTFRTWGGQGEHKLVESFKLEECIQGAKDWSLRIAVVDAYATAWALNVADRIHYWHAEPEDRGRQVIVEVWTSEYVEAPEGCHPQMRVLVKAYIRWLPRPVTPVML